MTAGRREAVLVVVCLAHAGLIALLFVARHAGRTEPDAPAPGVLMLLESRRAEEPPPPSVPRLLAVPWPAATSTLEPDVAVERDAPGALPPPPSGRPPTDWLRDAGAAARTLVEREAREAESGVPLNSKPKVLQLPGVAVQPPHQRGDSERLSTGETVVWMSPTVFCVSPPRGIPGTGVTRIPRCGIHRGPVAETELEEKVKPGYLRRALPQPKQ